MAAPAVPTTPVVLETPRLLLRQWRDDDYDSFVAMDGDAHVREFLLPRDDPSASITLANRCRAGIAERGWGFWALETKADGAFIGFAGLSIPGVALPFSPCVEIGWRLAFPAWGRGYATEAATEALRFGFDRLGLERIVAFTANGNVRSRRVMERLGMKYVGAFDHPSLPVGSPLRGHCWYVADGQKENHGKAADG